MSQAYDKLSLYIEKQMAFRQALTLFEWDNETLAPESAAENTSKAIGVISTEYFKTLINDDVKELLKVLSEEAEWSKLDFNQKAIVKNLKKSFEQMESIPPEEYRAYSELTAMAPGIWSKAKKNKSFEEFAPTLGEIIKYQKKFASYRKKGDEKLYDILLNDFEEGFSMDKLDIFFHKLKESLVPLMKKVEEKKDLIDKSYNYKEFDKEKQLEFARFISAYVGYDYSRGVLAESAHPFTTNLHNKDVRITTHIHSNNLESSIFSVIHESGHGIYEMNIADDISLTPVGGGSSMGIHESQSRFFENMLGRSKAFWTPVYPKLQETFPDQLKDISLDQFIAGINKSETGLIRTEADELSYSLHVIIRYEIEKMIFEGDISVNELPAIWNKKYKEYLGIEPSHDGEGILQDIHWAGGSFGYFPSYALGSAISAQIYSHMEKEIPVEETLRLGNLKPILDFLKEHIHKYGATKNTSELLTDMMQEDLNADYFVAYLTDKYTKLYQLD